ncbi:MAG: ATP-binding protein [Chloroflexi bacterium]|nr:ATP-binding protein [Chloroflexota bacterium]
MIKRTLLLQETKDALNRNRVVALIGARQCGKTTLARQIVSSDSPNYFDLENPVSLIRLDQPMTALQDLHGTIIIDEIQRRPDLFPILRVLSDREPLPARFLILGSASPALLRQFSESLAGRISMIRMSGFGLGEIGIENQTQHWTRGGFPLSFLAETDQASLEWRRDFIATFLERDVPQFGVKIPSAGLFRFWSVLAHYHGQVWNAAEAARTLNINESTARRYLDLLQDLFMVRQLQPWYSNLGKRQVKSPKIYFRDTGLLHYLLGIKSENELNLHPKSGASWEGYVIEEVIKSTRPEEVFFWATHSGAELDLLLIKDGKRIGMECKRMDAPKLTPSMRTAIKDLELDGLIVVYPGAQSYSLMEGITVLPLAKIVADPESLLRECK